MLKYSNNVLHQAFDVTPQALAQGEWGPQLARAEFESIVYHSFYDISQLVNLLHIKQ